MMSILLVSYEPVLPDFIEGLLMKPVDSFPSRYYQCLICKNFIWGKERVINILKHKKDCGARDTVDQLVRGAFVPPHISMKVVRP